jgi:hypothetical protein
MVTTKHFPIYSLLLFLGAFFGLSQEHPQNHAVPSFMLFAMPRILEGTLR